MSDVRYDAIVVGAGHNGLVSAVYLARAGWKVLVLERNEKVGGAVMSGEITRPGFVHDLYSTNQNLFLGSQAYADLSGDLERLGLRYSTSQKPYANVFPDGDSLQVYSDPDRTLELLRDHNTRDADGWSLLYEKYQSFSRTLLPLLGAPMPSAKAARLLARAVLGSGAGELVSLAQIMLSSTRELGEAYFATAKARALLAAWGLHLDFGPDVSGGALFPFVEMFADMEFGMSVVEGGASRMPEALAALIRESGGEVRTRAEVRQVLTDGDRATGVELDTGEKIQARRAVVANVTPTALFGRLLSNSHSTNGLQSRMKRYRYGPGTMMVHLALSDKPRWSAGTELEEFAYVHIGPYVEDLAQTYTDSINGYLPASPLLVVGQTSTVDPSRAPDGGKVLWVQVRTLPSQIRGDSAREISARDWDEAKEPYADRVMEKLEEYAPGIGDLVLDRAVFSPKDLERHNPNLVGGDSLAGSMHLRQNFLFRPSPGWSRYRMPLDGLYLTGASTWPGGGVNATSGYLAAQEVLNPQRWKRRLTAGAAGGLATAAGIAALKSHRRQKGFGK